MTVSRPGEHRLTGHEVQALQCKGMEEFEIPKPPRSNYLNAEHGLKSWLLTKRPQAHRACSISVAVSFFFFIGSLYAMAIRIELLTPQGDLMQSSTL